MAGIGVRSPLTTFRSIFAPHAVLNDTRANDYENFFSCTGQAYPCVT